MPLCPRHPLHHALLMASRAVKCSGGAKEPLFLLSNRFLHAGIKLFYLTTRKHASKTVLPTLRSSGANSLRPVVLSRTVHLAKTDEEPEFAEQVAALKSELEKNGIQSGKCSPGQYWRMLCPKCDGGSTKERSLALFIRTDGKLAFWNCFRANCGWRGHLRAIRDGDFQSNVSTQSSGENASRLITEESLQLEPLCEELIGYFSERLISAETLRRNAVMQRIYKNQVVIAFTYRRNGTLVNCKYRDIAKRFWQEKETERIFYGLDDIQHATDVIIVEGEIDKLSLEEAGYRNCVSVPDGAPPKVSETSVDLEKDKKFQYLWNCKEYLNKASRIILATDADAPGQALAEELARRLGKERCWRVQWPNNCKDANEVLLYLGPDALKEAIEKAELYPIRGLFSFYDFSNEIDEYYKCMNKRELGMSTGWDNVDKYYKVVPGELTVVSGTPNSGKSEWVDALLCNLNKSEHWSFVLCSMENKVRDHARKLLEKYIQKPFFNDVSYGESNERMSNEELQRGKAWLSKSFYLIRCEDDSLPSIDWVLSLAKAAVMRHGVNGLVIDPYNELDHQRPPNQTETEYVSQMLTKVKRFALHHSCHVWFVAHPRQLHNWTGGAPNLYDISGSAHFVNKCDNGIVVHRNRDPKRGPVNRTEIWVRKVRNKLAGSTGTAFLSYKRSTGEFFDDGVSEINGEDYSYGNGGIQSPGFSNGR